MTIYFIEMEYENKIKIGYTAKEAKRRMRELQTGQPQRLKLIGTIPGEKDGEHELHKEFDYLRVGGEWFDKSERLMRVIGFLVENQHPWYFCRAVRLMEEEWYAAFKFKDGIDTSAYDDTVDFRKQSECFSGRMSVMKVYAKTFKDEHGTFPKWWDALRKNLSMNSVAFRYNAAWQSLGMEEASGL